MCKELEKGSPETVRDDKKANENTISEDYSLLLNIRLHFMSGKGNALVIGSTC